MGEQSVKKIQTEEKRAEFIKHLLDDIKAMEWMLENDVIESGITRIGAEQEFCLVSNDWRPAKNSVEILAEINDPHFTTELARYNLEINLDPIELKDDCFTKVENQTRALLDKADPIAEKHGSKIVLTGILPTIGKTQLHLDYITPMPRYLALNEAFLNLKRANFHLHLQGVDELSISHDSVLFEACNTSFQTHLQIDPSDFISSYNWSQAIAGPILAICSNSPLLLGRELWNETRIALFRQSIDTRKISLALKDQQPRVSFGTHWAKGTAVDIFKENIAQYKIILTQDMGENSLEDVKAGKIPKLKAMNLHSGTIYPWNRACYGVGGGKPHLRIENRYLPSGPSVRDEMANFALWVGIMMARPKKYDTISEVMDFQDAKSNFIKAARYGKDSLQCWDNKEYNVVELMEEVMLPLAYEGLKKAGIDQQDIEKYLKVIERRLHGKTGSQWIISNYRRLKKKYTRDTALRMITKSMHLKQKQNAPVNMWADIKEAEILEKESRKVGHIMSTKLLTVKENDLADLATSIMEWKDIHHVPVENEEGELSGLLTWTHAQKFQGQPNSNGIMVKDIMVNDVVTVEAKTRINKAIEIMKSKEIGCLPVVDGNELIGIITIKDVIAFDND
ncbi:MAG: CBS domain-containing protein [Flavobacteriaceae bacterium]|nr:CBS domain-containing protein [Flavobacteriaceae bacterium]